MRRASEAITAVVEPIVTGLGYLYVGSEFGQAEDGQTLRVYIDTERPEGILIEDCVAVSHQLDAALDVEDPVKQAYRLEVSSPGVDRPLFTGAHFASVIGEEVRVRLGQGGPDGRRNYKGRLVSMAEDVATIEVDGIDHAVPLADMEQAHLIGRILRGTKRK